MNDQFRSQFRLPADLADQLREAAASSGRSMNAELIARLQSTFPRQRQLDLDPASPVALERMIAEQSEQLRALADLVGESAAYQQALVDAIDPKINEQLKAKLAQPTHAATKQRKLATKGA